MTYVLVLIVSWWGSQDIAVTKIEGFSTLQECETAKEDFLKQTERHGKMDTQQKWLSNDAYCISGPKK